MSGNRSDGGEGGGGGGHDGDGDGGHGDGGEVRRVGWYGQESDMKQLQ